MARESKAADDAAFVALEQEWHLDDFLNHMEELEHKIESLSAFAKLKKAAGEIKKPFSSWLKDFRDFESAIPH